MPKDAGVNNSSAVTDPSVSGRLATRLLQPRSAEVGRQRCFPRRHSMNCVVDAHQHFWTYGTYQTSWMEVPPYAGDLRFQPLRRSFQPDDLMPELKAAGVHCTVTIEVRRHGHPLFYSGRTLHPTFLLDCGEQFFCSFANYRIRTRFGSFHQRLSRLQPLAPSQVAGRQIISERTISIKQRLHAAHWPTFRSDPER